MISRRLGLWCLLGLFALPVALPQAALTQTAVTPTIAALSAAERDSLQRVEAHLTAMRTLKARFIQRTQDGKQAGGSLLMARPGRFRFEYAPPAKILIVSDGSLVSFVDYEFGQLTQWPLFNTPISHLVRKDMSLFKDTLIDQVRTEPGFISFRLRNPDDPDQGWIMLNFADRPVRLLGWRLSDAQGQITNVALSNVALNNALPESAFRFDPPKAPWKSSR